MSDVSDVSAAAPARLYIGSDPSQAIAAEVLQFSVRRHASMPVEFDTMESVRLPFPSDPRNQPRTDFSFHRFAIPKLAGRAGRAAYVDADMLVFRDIRELWSLPFGDAAVLYAPSSDPERPKQFSVMLLDCARLDWDAAEIVAGLDAGRYDYDQLLTAFCIEPAERVQPRIPVEWNSLDLYVPGRTGLLHYTHMETQPWVHARHPHGDLWVEALADAIAAGAVTPGAVEDAVGRGWARPSLPAQLRTRRSLWPVFKRAVAPFLDRDFRPHAALRDRQARVRDEAASA